MCGIMIWKCFVTRLRLYFRSMYFFPEQSWKTFAGELKRLQRIRKAFAEEIPDTTKLIIAQRISSIQSADRIIVMEDGRINGFGTHEELLENNPIYQEVYHSQTKAGGDFDENRGGEQA